MAMRHNSTSLLSYFKAPPSSRQHQYETVRAVIVDGLSIKKATERFGYKPFTAKILLHNARRGMLELFPHVKHDPKGRHTSVEVQERIVEIRKNKMSSVDIQRKLMSEAEKISVPMNGKGCIFRYQRENITIYWCMKAV